MAVRHVVRVLLSVCFGVLALWTPPAAAQVVDVDHDGIPDSLEDGLVLQHLPIFHPWSFGDCFSIFRKDPQTGNTFASVPLTVYRAFNPTYLGVANPDVIVIAFSTLHDRDCGFGVPPGFQSGHLGDNEGFLYFFRFDESINNWRLESLSATAHYAAAVCEHKSAAMYTNESFPPRFFIGKYKNSNHLDLGWEGCPFPGHPDNDVLAGPPQGVDILMSPVTFFNVGEANAQRLNNLGLIDGFWDGERVWDDDQFFEAGNIRETFRMNPGRWKELTTPTADPNVSWDINPDGGTCTPEGMLSPTAADVEASGGTGTVNVGVPFNCAWRIDGEKADWIHPSVDWSSYQTVTGATTTRGGGGFGIVSFSVDPNPSSTARTGTFLIGTTQFTVNQPGVACTFSVNQSSIDIGAGGITNGAVDFTVGAGDCPWNASTDASWLSFGSATSGQGSGQVRFNATANESPSPRMGHIFVGGRTATVNQAGVGCNYDVSWSNQPFGIAGGSGTINVTASPAACTWSATSTASWITITSTSSTQVTFSVSANTGGHDRSGTLSVAGHTVTINQAGNLVPVVQITAPANGAMFGRGATITAAASASDADGVARVDFYVDGALAGSDTTAPYSVPVSGLFWGWHSISAKAVDTLGAEGQSAAISFAVEPSAIDIPASNVRVSSGFPVGGWAIDLRSTNGTGVDLITAYAVRLGSGTPIPLGTSNGGVERPDVAAIFGQQFRYCGFNLVTSPLAAGTYDVYVAAHMTADGSTHNSVTTRVIVLTDVTRAADFDGDRKSDPLVYNTATGAWLWLTSGSGFTSLGTGSWGGGPYMPAPGDYDGDGKADLGLYVPSTGNWNVLLSGANYTTSISKDAGGPGWTAVPGDYDGDGKTDFAVYNTTTGVWYGLNSSSNYTTSFNVSNGGSGWTAVPADFDGDGRTDLGAYQTTTANWSVRLSSTSYTTTLSQAAGGSGWVPVAADYDGDGKADVAVYNTGTGVWYGLKSSTNYTTSFNISWGGTGYMPIKGDYDGDGKADLALYVGNGTWSILLSGANYTTSLSKTVGGLGYVPVPQYPQ